MADKQEQRQDQRQEQRGVPSRDATGPTGPSYSDIKADMEKSRQKQDDDRVATEKHRHEVAEKWNAGETEPIPAPESSESK